MTRWPPRHDALADNYRQILQNEDLRITPPFTSVRGNFVQNIYFLPSFNML